VPRDTELEDPQDLRAEIGKCPISTNERKNMSTKTLRKRIALVAVATLGAGVLSVAPANAAWFAGNGTNPATASAGICSQTATSVTVAAGGQLVFDDADYAAGGGTGTPAITAASGPLLVVGGNGSYVVDTSDVLIKVTGVGTGTVQLLNASLSPLKIINVTAVASCGSGIALSKSYVQVSDVANNFYRSSQVGDWAATATTFDNTDTATYANTSADRRTKFANGETAYVNVSLQDLYAAELTSGFVTVTADKPVLVNGAPLSAVKQIEALTPVESRSVSFSINQAVANAPVTTKITISYNGTVVGTKDITFTGDAASITASYDYSGLSGQAADAAIDPTTGRISYSIKDSAGNTLDEVAGDAGNYTYTTSADNAFAVSMSSSSNAALVSTLSNVRTALGAAKTTTTARTASGRFIHNCINSAVSGSSDVTLELTNNAGKDIVSNAVTATCSGTTASYTASFDKATYKTGDIATLTIKGLDARGKAVADNTTLGNGDKSSVAVPGMTAVTAPVSTDASSEGAWVYTYTVNTTAGSYAGAVTIAGALVQVTPATVQYTITDGAGGVSNADVLKAIVSLIASINKQIAALQKALLKK
jgi:hypothetical protein